MASSALPVNPDLCDYCQRINVNSIVAYGASDATIKPQQAGLIHQPNYDALRESSKSCPLCALFHDGIERKNSGTPISPGFASDKRSRVWLHAGDHAFTDLRTPKALYHVVVNVGGGAILKAAAFSITTQPGEFLLETRRGYGPMW
jgi:hypothetical protein